MATSIILPENMESIEPVDTGMSTTLATELESFPRESSESMSDHNNDSEDEEDIQFRKKKRVIASDSEDEAPEKVNTSTLNDEMVDSDSDTELPSTSLNKSKSRIIVNDDNDSSAGSETENKLVNSDSDLPSDVEVSKKSKKENTAGEDDDNDLPSDVEVSNRKKSVKKRNASDEDDLSVGSPKSRGRARRGAPDSDTDDIPASYVDVFKNSDVFAAESSSDEERKPYNNDRNASDSDEKNKNSKNSKQSKAKKPKKPKPVSQKQREKELAEVTSRTQKMLRESHVSLPYHRPRQLTLDEFLKKRSAKAPILNNIIKSSCLKSVGGKIVLPDVKSMETEVIEIVEDAPSPKKELPPPQITEISSSCNLDDIPDTVDPVQGWLETVTPNNVEDLCDVIESDTTAQAPSSVVENSLAPKEKIILVNEEKMAIEQEVEAGEKMKEIAEEKSDEMEMEVEKVINCNEIVKDVTDSDKDKIDEKVDNMETDNNEQKIEEASKVKEESSRQNDIPKSNAENENVAATIDQVITKSFDEQQAELTAYLESMKPVQKPKKLTIAERIKQLPGFSNLKPKIGKNSGGTKKGIIDLNVGKGDSRDSHQKSIQTLMDRFVHHTNVIKPSKEQHYKLHVTKKEEDSQGLINVTVDEVDYIKVVNSDEEEEKVGSPTQIPGSKMVRVQERLKQKIYAQKKKEFEEKLKLHAMYAEEKELEDKNTDYDPLPENEEIEEMSESEVDEDEEEELEELLSSKVKEKRRKKHAYVDDEAEDSDDNGDADNEDQDDESSDDDDDDDEDDDNENTNDNDVNDVDSKADGTDFVDGEYDHDFPVSDTLPSAQPQLERKALTEAASNSSVKISLQRLDLTGRNEQTTPSDLWLRPAPRCPVRITAELEKVNEERDSAANQFSEVEEEASQESSLPASECKSPMPSAVADLVEVIGDSNGANTEDILAVCSGAFPSQQPCTPEESQNCFGFDDDDDDLILATLDETGNQVDSKNETPKATENNSKSVLENDTPKMVERISTTKRLFFAQNAETETDTPKTVDKISKIRLFSSDSVNDGLENYDSDDNESVVGAKTVRKRKRLEFSDDEEEEEEKIVEEEEEEDAPEPEEYEESEKVVEDDEEMAMEMEARTVKPKKSLFGKDGRLRKAFIDAEAELSGSEEGSEDEDERGMDRMEIEEGDEEIIDEEEVREKVGRAHLKALLDQDDEEIQHIQNELLHDGDLHMDAGRERNFKWNYMEYNMDDDGANMGDFGDDTPIDEAEVKRQIEKAEKNKWIKENSQFFEESQQESQKSILDNTNFLRLSKSSLKKFTSFSESSSFQGCDVTAVGDASIAFTSFSRLLTGQVKNSLANTNSEKTSEEAQLCKATSQPLFASPDEPIAKLRRGSFLSRGAPTLSRLAEMTKISDSVSNVKSNSKNFVFSVVTPPDAGENSKSKKQPMRRNQSMTSNPKKMLKIDRSFNSLDATSKDASIFKWM